MRMAAVFTISTTTLAARLGLVPRWLAVMGGRPASSCSPWRDGSRGSRSSSRPGFRPEHAHPAHHAAEPVPGQRCTGPEGTVSGHAHDHDHDVVAGGPGLERQHVVEHPVVSRRPSPCVPRTRRSQALLAEELAGRGGPRSRRRCRARGRRPAQRDLGACERGVVEHPEQRAGPPDRCGRPPAGRAAGAGARRGRSSPSTAVAVRRRRARATVQNRSVSWRSSTSLRRVEDLARDRGSGPPRPGSCSGPAAVTTAASTPLPQTSPTATTQSPSATSKTS